MSTKVSKLIESIASGENAKAKERFEEAISQKAADYLNEYKRFIAESMYKKKEDDEDEEIEKKEKKGKKKNKKEK